MDFLEYANQEAQSSAIQARMANMLGSEEDRRAETTELIASGAKHELSEVSAELASTKDDAVANIQQSWDFIKRINSDVDDIEPDQILEQLAEIRQNHEALRQRLEQLKARHATHSRAAGSPDAATDELFRKFPSLNKTGRSLGDPDLEAEVEVEDNPTPMPTGQRTRRRPINLDVVSDAELVRRFPALRR